ncbi:MAG: DciA family protein [Methylophilaceae bacterium]
MEKINNLLNLSDNKVNDQLNTLVTQANKHLDLQQFWQAIAPKAVGQSSFVGSLNNGRLLVFALNNSVAAKIKLTSTSLLTQLQNLQKTDPFYKQYKVTGISVKVQVKSQQKRATVERRTISRCAANTLNQLADSLGESALADKLKKLADSA